MAPAERGCVSTWPRHREARAFAHVPAARLEHGAHLVQLIAHEYDGCDVAGRVHAARHGDAHVGRRERRRVVDAVAHHRHAAALGDVDMRVDMHVRVLFCA